MEKEVERIYLEETWEDNEQNTRLWRQLAYISNKN